ncbi:MAG: DUF1801 domain-containing protein [Woeseiaceae bacterium]|nr:DUF1801 domain-containing protein [Woeseiaceae bacterium]
MANLKTRPTSVSVKAFIDAVDDVQKRKDARKVAAMMRRATGKRAKMWGDSIVGFGTYRYSNTAGKNFEWPVTGLSPRAGNLTLYIMPGFSRYDALMKKLGKHKTGKSCLYINKLSDVDETVLETLITESVARMCEVYETDLK